jgi:ATP-dependent DNA ligase
MLKRFRHPDKPKECTPELLPTLRPHEWLSQHKYDGWRLEIYKSAGMILLPDGQTPAGMSLLSRVGRFISARSKMPEVIIQQLLRLPIPDETVIDAEFVGPRGGHEPRVYIFDCLAWDDAWLPNEPYVERWARCQDLANGQDVCLAETRENDFFGHFNELKDDWIAGGMGMHLTEGIVLKKKRGKLQLDLNSSKKSRCQFKLKYRDITSERY